MSDWCIHTYYSKHDKLPATVGSVQIIKGESKVCKRASAVQGSIQPHPVLFLFLSKLSSMRGLVSFVRSNFLGSPRFLFLFLIFMICHQCNNRELVTSVSLNQIIKRQNTDLNCFSCSHRPFRGSILFLFIGRPSGHLPYIFCKMHNVFEHFR